MAYKEPRHSPKMANLNHKVALCTMLDVVSEDGWMKLSRKPVAWVWAGVRAPRPSFLSPAGYSMMEDQERVTHIITIRMQAEISINATAWVYEELLRSPPRWYKVVGFADFADRFVRLHCKLYERSDEVQPPRSILSAEPQESLL